MESREPTFADIMVAWRASGGRFVRGMMTVAFFPKVGEILRDDRWESGAIREARFRHKALSYADNLRRLHEVDVVFDEVTGYIVDSSHGLEGYRLKDGEIDAPNPRLASDGSLVFERSPSWLDQHGELTQKERRLLFEAAGRCRVIAARVGPLHGMWDAIFDAQALLAGGKTLLSGSPREIYKSLMRSLGQTPHSPT